jgi:hypothetical protein
MQFYPRFDQPTLAFWQVTREQIAGVDAKHRDMLLIIGMEMGHVMLRFHFHKHPNDDSKKPADFRHYFTASRRPKKLCDLLTNPIQFMSETKLCLKKIRANVVSNSLRGPEIIGE